MKYRMICLVLLSSVLLASCASVAAPPPTPTPTAQPSATAEPSPTVEPTPTDEPPTATPPPITSLDLRPWGLVRQVKYEHAVNLAGFLNDTFGITVGYAGAIRYTNDGGQTWGRGRNVSQCRFGLDIVDEKVAWNAGNAGNVRFTVDGGDLWQDAEDYGPFEPKQMRFVSFLDDKTGWIASPYQLGATKDGGKTWVDLALPQGSGDIVTIALRTATDGYVLDSKGTLLVSADGGQTWTTRSLGLKQGEGLTFDRSPLAALRFMDANRGLAVYTLNNQQVWTAWTTDGGQTWQRVQLPLPPKPYNLYLSHDGQYLTIHDAGRRTITLLRYKQP